VGEGGLLVDAGDGHINDICCWVVSDGTSSDDYGEICRGNRVVVTLLHEIIKEININGNTPMREE
jgi:hypothetical protein